MVKVKERFESKVDRTGDCHVWTGHKWDTGYGSFWYQGRSIGAHVMAWILEHGDNRNGLHVLHSCPGGDTRHCVNPDHLRLGTPQDNMNDKMDRGTYRNGRTAMTLAQAREVKAYLAQGVVMRDIAAFMRLTRNQVEKISAGLTWVNA
jgi:hypothetical protein